MTIPIAPVNISPPLAPPAPSGVEQFFKGYEVVALALQRRAELEQAKQQLLQDREKFELQKKLTGTQISGMELEQEKMKRQFKAQDEDLVAQDEALRIFTGNLPTANDPKAWGQVIANVKDPLVGGHLMNLIQGMFELRGKGAGAEGQELKNQASVLDMAEDRQISQTLQRMSGREWNKRTIGEAVGRVVAINPQKAGQVATALNALLPDWQVVIGDRGEVDLVDKNTGATARGGLVAPKRPTDEQGKLADYATRVIEGHAILTKFEQDSPGIGQRVDARLRALRALEQVPAFGRPAATAITPAVLRSMSPGERRYANARIDVANALLRRASGAQINMEELDRETAPYVPVSGEDESVILQKQTLRLQRGLGFAEQSQGAFNPNRLSPAARGYLLQNIVPHPGYSPDNPFVKQPGTAVIPR